MAILHTPRSLAAIARGMLKRRRKLQGVDPAVAATDAASRFVGFVPASNSSSSSGSNSNNRHDGTNLHQPHVYRSRPSLLWDVDYMGHVNNAAYLNHAEYARWEWICENGALSAMHQEGLHFVVTHCSIRFRKEIRAGQPFAIHSALTAFDDKHLWLHQTFRSQDNDKTAKKNEGGANGTTGRILAQVLVQAAVIQNRRLVPPRRMLEAVGVPDDLAEALVWKGDDDEGGATDEGASFLQRFRDLDEAFREEATADDERLRGGSVTKRNLCL